MVSPDQDDIMYYQNSGDKKRSNMRIVRHPNGSSSYKRNHSASKHMRHQHYTPQQMSGVRSGKKSAMKSAQAMAHLQNTPENMTISSM
jgi:hypothetical protein